MANEPDTIEEDQPIEIDLGDDEALALAQEQEPAVEKEPVVEKDKGGPELVADQLAAAQSAWTLREAELVRERDEALRYAQEKERGEWEAGRQALQTHSDLVNTALQSAQSEQLSAKQAYKVAFEAGDPDAMADANARGARAATDIRQYEIAAADAAQREDYAKRQPPPQQRQQTQQRLSPEEILARNEVNPNLLPSEKAWLRRHEEASLEPEKQKQLKDAYDFTRDKGIVRGSEQYFQILNERLGYEKPMAQERTQERTNGSKVSAPVSRASGGPSAKPQTVKLTPDDIQIAASFGFTSEADLKEYARNKLKVPDRQKELNQRN